jgi:hypothetical protein
MANVKITALEHLSSTQAAPEDVFVIDHVGPLITKKITLSNVTKYLTNVTGNAKIVESNLNNYASYANANAAALSLAISNISASFSIAGDVGTDIVVVGSETLTFRGTNGVNTTVGANELIISMSNTGVSAGSYGGMDGTVIRVPSITVDTQGRITLAQNTNVIVDFSSVQANINIVQSNLTSIGNNLQSNIDSVQSNLTYITSNLQSNVIAAQSDINNLQSAISSTTNSVQSNLNSVQSNLTITTSNLQTSINYVQSNVNLVQSNLVSTAGNLNNLVTTDKSNLVAAINELSYTGNYFDSIETARFTLQGVTVNNVSSLGAVIFSEDKANVHFAKLLINVEDLTYGQYQSSELLLLQDTADIKIVEYAMIFTSTNPLVTYEASFVGSNVELFATATSANNRINVLKIIN